MDPEEDIHYIQGLQLWVTSEAEELEAQIHSLGMLIKDLTNQQEELIDRLPPGMATCLGYRSSGPISIKPYAYFYMKTHPEVTIEEAIRIINKAMMSSGVHS